MSVRLHRRCIFGPDPEMCGGLYCKSYYHHRAEDEKVPETGALLMAYTVDTPDGHVGMDPLSTEKENPFRFADALLI